MFLDLLLITDENQVVTENHVIIGSMLCLKMLLPLFPNSLIDNTSHGQHAKTSLTSQQLKSATNLQCVTAERLIQVPSLLFFLKRNNNNVFLFLLRYSSFLYTTPCILRITMSSMLP